MKKQHNYEKYIQKNTLWLITCVALQNAKTSQTNPSYIMCTWKLIWQQKSEVVCVLEIRDAEKLPV